MPLAWALYTVLVLAPGAGPAPFDVASLLAMPGAPVFVPDDAGPRIPDAAELERLLASSLRPIVPGSIVGPLAVGELGAVVAGVRCVRRSTYGCEVVVAHLALADHGRALVLSGLVAALPARGRDVRVERVAARDVVGDPLPELVVRWRAASAPDEEELAVIDWGGFRPVTAPLRVIGGVAEAPRLWRVRGRR